VSVLLVSEKQGSAAVWEELGLASVEEEFVVPMMVPSVAADQPLASRPARLILRRT